MGKPRFVEGDSPMVAEIGCGGGRPSILGGGLGGAGKWRSGSSGRFGLARR
jgi:hypothetical protein